MSKESALTCMTEYELRMVKGLFYDEAFSGDQEIGVGVLDYLFGKIENHDSLDELDQTALLVMIDRIRKSSHAVNVVCGVERKPGRTKRGMKSLKTALAVYKKIHFEELSANEAWESVAEDMHQSSSMVKKSWMKWKDELDEKVDLSLAAEGLLPESQNTHQPGYSTEEPGSQGPTKP